MIIKKVCMSFISFVLGLLMTENSFAQQHEIAITIDDLPFVGARSSTPGDVTRTHERFSRLLNTLVEYQIPVTGFVIAGAIGKGQWELLEQFQKEGFQLGNHTWSHPSLNSMNADSYISNIDKADKKLSSILGTPKYFRYPYLAEGTGSKKQKVLDYLTENGYSIATVTIDSKDYRFNSQLLAVNWRLREKKVESIKKRYLEYIEKQTERAEKISEKSSRPGRQILLIHANLLNSYCLGDIIELYKQRGYKFISLEDALKSPAAAIIAPTTDVNIENEKGFEKQGDNNQLPVPAALIP